jgi:hypothetical protein
LGGTKIRSVTYKRCKFFDLHATNKSKFAEKHGTKSQPFTRLKDKSANQTPAIGSESVEIDATNTGGLHTWIIALNQLAPDGGGHC